MFLLPIDGYKLGSRRRTKLFDGFSVPIPPSDPDNAGDGGLTLRQLIERVVRHEVAAFEERQEARQFVRALSADEIQEGAKAGKIDSGGSEIEPTNVDPETAVAIAIQAFEDGLYLVVIDDEEKRDLDAQIFLHAGSRMTFIRLTLLSG